MFSAAKGLSFDDVLLVPGYNGIRSRQDVTTQVSLGNKTFRLPLVSSNMDTITEVRMADCMSDLGGMSILHRFMAIDENVKMFKALKNPHAVGFSIGVGESGILRAEALVAAGAEICCVDVAHGHSKEVNRTIRELRKKWGENLMIIAGNVASYAGADYLAAAGADVIKVGIGSGSVCTTRIKTGFGVPQLAAIFDCRKVDRPLIADGGIRMPADVVKALAAGASAVMLGGMLAGCEETPGQLLEKNGKSYKVFRGMASREAQEDYMGAMSEWKTAEGVSLEVPLNGQVADVVRDIMGGVRSGLTYCGASSIVDLQKKAQFIEITASAQVEGLPHAQMRALPR